jgi:glycosyltransferase involved in cell wall biosynthesis
MQQLLREWPPGYGGVERVAHSLADELGGTVFALRHSRVGYFDPLTVPYKRRLLPSLPLARFRCPFPSQALMELLLSRQPLLAHLPCPTVLFLALIAQWLQPQRLVRFYWHAFLDPRPGIPGWLERLYQRLALRLLRPFPVITTSPVLLEALQAEGLCPEKLACLPCVLPMLSEQEYEHLCLLRRQQGEQIKPNGRLIAIGRLDSYKRIDWLIRAMEKAPAVRELHVVGEGPDRPRLEALARQCIADGRPVCFHGRVGEARKLQLLAEADVLVLPADRCNEAFGIVQLEAMACGIPALAFQLPRSGMHWVSSLPDLPWRGDPLQLPMLLQRLLLDQDLYRRACEQARVRYEQHFCRASWRRQLDALALLER